MRPDAEASKAVSRRGGPGIVIAGAVGYAALQFVVHVPTVLFLVWILNYTLRATF